MFNTDSITKLDYDFSGFYEGGPSGVVPEPSTSAISDYQLAMADLLAEGAQRVEAIVGGPAKDEGSTTVAEEEEDPDVEREKNMQVSKINDEVWTERKRLLAELCAQQPSFEDLCKLGHRVFVQFEEYVLGRWTPQAGSAATS